MREEAASKLQRDHAVKYMSSAREVERHRAASHAAMQIKLAKKLRMKKTLHALDANGDGRVRGLSFMYRYILRESCSQFDSLPLTSLTISGTR